MTSEWIFVEIKKAGPFNNCYEAIGLLNRLLYVNGESRMVNLIAQSTAFFSLFIGSFIFGVLGKPSEMGLCIVASSIGLAFSNIDKIKRFKGGGFEAEMLERKVDVLIAKESEPDVEQIDASAPSSGPLRPFGFGLDEPTRNVVKALGNSKFTWRSVNGISRGSGLSVSQVNKCLHWLEMNELVVAAGIAHKSAWGLSEEGRNLFNSVMASSK